MSAPRSSVLACDALTVRLDGRVLLDGLTAAFAPGRITVIVGPNGAGKSTWLACLAGLRTPQAGRAALDGAPVLALQARERARRIGVLPQTPEILWSLDVETLVGLGRIPHAGAFGLDEPDRSAVASAIAACGLTAFARRGVDTLSGGERTRALVARAIAGEPEWLLADEPLTGLDPGHQLDAADLFRRLADEGRGVILTLHDLALATRIADRVVVLADGRMLADGAPGEALTPGVLARAYRIEARLTEGVGGPVLELVGRTRPPQPSPPSPAPRVR